MKPDPAIEEIRAIRRQISAECGHDAARYLELLGRIEEAHPGRVIRTLRTAPNVVAPDSGKAATSQ